MHIYESVEINFKQSCRSISFQRQVLKVTLLFSRAMAAFRKNTLVISNIGSTHMDEALSIIRREQGEENHGMDRDPD